MFQYIKYHSTDSYENQVDKYLQECLNSYLKDEALGEEEHLQSYPNHTHKQLCFYWECTSKYSI